MILFCDQIMFPHKHFSGSGKPSTCPYLCSASDLPLPCQRGFLDPYGTKVTSSDAVTGNYSTYSLYLWDQEKYPRIIKTFYANMLGKNVRNGGGIGIGSQTIHRKFLHVDNGLIPKEIIHRKRLYIRHEKDPHPTGRISTSGRKYLHDSASNSLKNINKNLS